MIKPMLTQEQAWSVFGYQCEIAWLPTNLRATLHDCSGVGESDNIHRSAIPLHRPTTTKVLVLGVRNYDLLSDPVDFGTLDAALGWVNTRPLPLTLQLMCPSNTSDMGANAFVPRNRHGFPD